MDGYRLPDPARETSAERGWTFHDLVLAHHTIRHADFASRVDAAADHAYAGIGLSGSAYDRLIAEGARTNDLRAVLDARGQRVLELEALRGWSARGRELADSRVAEDRFYEMSATLGPARHLQVIGPFHGSIDAAARKFGAVCDRAAEHCLVVALEFIPEFTNIPDIATARSIVERADRPNGGICIDSWHLFRGPSQLADLESVPPELIALIQLDDGPLVPEQHDYLADTMSARVAPGDGEFELHAFLDALGYVRHSVPMSIEVISTRYDRMPPQVVAGTVAAATRRLLRSHDEA